MKSFVFSLLCAAVVHVFAASPKYVFLFIGDGMSFPQRMTAEEFSRKTGAGPLAMNAMQFAATTRTSSFDSLVTDSAAAATAIACGKKTKNHYAGVDADGKTLVSSASAAKKAGRKVGIITTVTITHATPAGFYAHNRNRGDTYGIALDLAESEFDFFAGGGLDISPNVAKASKRFAECGDASEYIRSKGYGIVDSKKDFLSLGPGCGKILALFSRGVLTAAIDADGTQPTIAEMVAKCIEMLDGEDGFFIMAEGGSIDWACHANDAATNLREILAMDDAVKLAVEFQKKHPDDTLVVVTGDHETGGMSMGFAGAGYALYVERLAFQTMSVGSFSGKVAKMFEKSNNLSFDDVKPLITEAFGFHFEGDPKKDPMVLGKEDIEDIAKAFDHDFALYASRVEENTKYDGMKRYHLGGACRLVMSNKCGLGWTSGSHTAMPVLTTASGCGAEHFSGFLENADIGRIMKGFYE